MAVAPTVDCIILRETSFPIINIDDRREGSILSPTLMVEGRWLLVMDRSPPWMAGADPQLLGIIFRAEGGRLIHLISSVLMI